jgi:hypothetical protein
MLALERAILEIWHLQYYVQNPQDSTTDLICLDMDSTGDWT